ncbi:MAG: SulP family inorganic anion transporter [Deltaproteobacteria bacterium]|nr:SulP family inorganic anion transporter [Deltaproteobacteria bacterium]
MSATRVVSRLQVTLLRRIPALDSLRRYTFAAARADVVAGLSVAAVAVPQAMAYAMIAGLPVQYGLYTAVVMTAVGALLDSSRQLINGPTNAISIAVLSAVGGIAALDDKIQTVMLIGLLVGAIQLGISLVRIGDLTRYISHSVIVGFTAGASLLLVLDQTKNLLGLTAVGDAHDHFLYRFWLTLTEGGAVHLLTLGVGLASVALVLALRWLKGLLGWRLLPELLLVVIVMAAATAHFGWDRQGVKVVGEIPAALPSLRVPRFDLAMMRELASGALAIALLGLLEAISMAKAIAAVTRQRLDLNQQCLSEGVANLAGSFFQCMPGSGSLTRSAINQQAGAQTQWSGVVSAGAVALIMVLFAPYARFIPRSALAGLLMVTALRMVSFKDLRYHVHASRFDAAIVAVTAIAAFAISIEFCVLIGVVMSFLLAVPRTGQMLLAEFVVTPDGTVHERLERDCVCGHMLVFGLEGEMYFGAGASLEQHLDVIERRATADTQAVVLRMKRARNPDAVGMGLLEGCIDRLRARGVHVVLCGVRHEMIATMKKCGLAAKLGEANIFLEQPVRQTSTLLAIRYAYDLLSVRCAGCTQRDPGNGAAGLYYVI